MKTRIIACVVAAALASPRLASQAAVTMIRELTAPTNATIRSALSHGAEAGGRQVAGIAADTPAADRYFRLATDSSVPLIADHYAAQLVARGWSVAFRQSGAMLALVRFSTGSSADPMTGTLTVVPFPAPGQVVVSVRLVRSHAPWRGTPRSGGGGAAAARGVMADFGFMDHARTLLFPREVVRVESQGGGGGPDYMLSEMRLQTALAAEVLMMHLQSQLPPDGWTVDAHVGDAVQAVVRRSTLPTPDTSEIWMLTSMPGTNDIDLALTVLKR